MKKILSILLVVMLVLSLSATAFADNFISSVANAGAPELEESVDADGANVDDALEVVPNDEAEKLEEEEQKAMEDAYKSLDEAKELTALNEDLKEAAAGRATAISDLFTVKAKKEVKFPLKITLKNKNLNNFVGLMQFINGKWEWIDAEVDGGKLIFSADSLGVFAIIVAVDEAASPATGETVPYGFILGAVVLVGAAAWFFTKSRKVKA